MVIQKKGEKPLKIIKGKSLEKKGKKRLANSH